jgi:putative ABC transport system permease protein
MTPVEVVQTAFRAIRENRLRASLSVLGVVIGVGSVLLLISIGIGVRADIARQVEALGTNVAFVVPGKLDESGRPNGMSMMGISTLTLADADALARVPGVRAAIPVTFVAGAVERKGTTDSAIVLAADYRMSQVRKDRTAQGSFYTAADEGKRVCVIGDQLKRDVFGTKPAVGQTIALRGIAFTVVGVLRPEEPTAFAEMSFSRVCYVPWRTAQAVFPGAQINRIVVQTDYTTDPDQIVGNLKAAMRANHATEDFGILTYRQLLAAIFRVFNIVTALIVGISAISLLVAGIGIMNIMLVTVTERTREIGIRMTVGARKRDVFLQFLSESVGLSLAGGLLGVLLAYVGVVILNRFTVLKPIITPGALALALGVCIAVGILFGTAPAARAARLYPVDALRFE